MKPLALLAAVLLLCGTAQAGAEISNQFDTDFSLTSGVRTDLGNQRSGDVSEVAAAITDVVSIRLGEGPLLRLGASYQRFSFGLPDDAPLPNTMQSISAVIGFDLQLFESWLVRLEALPGFYSASPDFSGNDFNIPFIIGASYIASADLQWILGVSVDVNRWLPVFPGAGVRWKFADQWVLNAVMPKPRVEYSLSKDVTLYGGAELLGMTSRVSKDFGDTHGNKKLNGAVVDLFEVRAGVGAQWKISSWFQAEFEAGCVAYRDIDYSRADQNYQNRSAGAYGQFVIGAKF
jgi:hypothetical protein